MQDMDATEGRFARDDRRVRDGDLLTRDILAGPELFAVRIAGLAALSLDGTALSREFGRLVGDGVDPALAEDVLVQMAAYIGYPRAAAALAAFRSAAGQEAPCGNTAESSDRDRYERGTAAYAQVNATALAAIEGAFADIAGDMIELTFRSFGDVFATSRQPLAVRQIATVAALAALGGVEPQLRFHIGAALHAGVSREQLVEAIMWVQYLAGMPAAYNALIELKGALAAGADAPPAYR